MYIVYYLFIMYNIIVKKVKNFKKVGAIMDIAKISSKGQITIPIAVRNKLKLKNGDKVVIFEENGRFYLENAAMLAFNRVEKAFQGVAEEIGYSTEEEMQEYMQEIRKEVRGY